MKIIDGIDYFSIGEVAKAINRSTTSIKNWYEWAEEEGQLDKLPEMIRVGVKQVRYFRVDEIKKLTQFRDQIKYGSMSEFNERKWGERGIKSKRSVDFTPDTPKNG